jgi:DNA-binding transcriptional LysR family regulator
MAGLIPAIIDRVRRRYPKIFVEVEHAEGASPEFRELRDRKVDLIIFAGMRESLIHTMIEHAHRINSPIHQFCSCILADCCPASSGS